MAHARKDNLNNMAERERKSSSSEESSFEQFDELNDEDSSASETYPCHEVRAWRFEPPGRQRQQQNQMEEDQARDEGSNRRGRESEEW